MKPTLTAFASGLLFALGLGVAGLTLPAKVLAFLDVSGAWDPSLAFVMVGAIIAFTGINRLAQRRPAPVYGGAFPATPSGKVKIPLLVGAALFGLGWGLVGLCPGPAIASIGTGDPKLLAFVAAMVAGAWIFQRQRGGAPSSSDGG